MVETAQFENLTDTEQSSEEIRQKIVAKEEKISETVEEVSERLKETLDWRQYVGNYPYLTLGIAAGLGLLASRMLPKRPTTMEKVGDIISEATGNCAGELISSRRPNIILSSLTGLAMTMVAGLVKNAVTAALSGESRGSSSQCPSTTPTTETESV